MEWVEGCKVNDQAALLQASIRPTEVAVLLLDAFAEMTYVHGFVHADPHPGNILVRPAPDQGLLPICWVAAVQTAGQACYCLGVAEAVPSLGCICLATVMAASTSCCTPCCCWCHLLRAESLLIRSPRWYCFLHSADQLGGVHH